MQMKAEVSDMKGVMDAAKESARMAESHAAAVQIASFFSHPPLRPSAWPEPKMNRRFLEERIARRALHNELVLRPAVQP